MAGDFSDLYDDYGVPPIDLDDQSAIQGALAADQASAPVTPATVAPLGVEELLAAVPADWRAQAGPPVDPLDDLPLATTEEPGPAPAELAPDFRLVDYELAKDRLATPRLDPTGAARAAADAERSLTELEARQGTLQASVVDRSRELQQIDGQFAAASQIADPKERKARLAELQEQRNAAAGALEMDRAAYQQLGSEVQTAQRARQSARQKYVEEQAVADREGAIAAVEAQTAAMAAAQAQDEALIRDARAKEAELQETQSAAERELIENRTAYRDLLERGPQETTKSTVLAVASVIGEILMARAHGGRPDLARAIAGVEQATKDDFQRRLAARMAKIQDTGDEITRAGREREVFRAETAARRAEIYSTIDRELETKLAQGKTLSQQAAYIAARDDVRAALEAEEAQLLAANAKLARAQRRDDMELSRLAAETELAQAKAAKERGGGGPGATAAAGARTNISENALVDPVTGVVLGESRFTERGKVREDQDTINTMSNTLTDMQEYINLLANTGRVYQGLGAKHVKDTDVALLQSKYNKILADIIRAYSGAAATDAEVERLKQVLPPPKSYSDLGSWDLGRVVREYRDTHNGVYERFLTSRLTTGGTSIRGPRGEVLPTSPTYGWRAERGDAPIRTMVGDVIVDLNHDNKREFDWRLAGWVNKAASLTSEERAKIVEGMRSAADVMGETGQKERARATRAAIKQVEQGEHRQTEHGTTPLDPAKALVTIRRPNGATTQVRAWKWEQDQPKFEASGWSLVPDQSDEDE